MRERLVNTEPIILIGMMGSGKSTVGRKLARETRSEFLDLDREIERRNGVSISTIFEIEGEAGFRIRESQLLAEVVLENSKVLATGGGIVLNPLNRTRLLASESVIYLHATPGLLYSRTCNDKCRPLIQVIDPLARITQLVEWRDPLYREVADVVIEAGNDLNEIVNQIEKSLESRCKQ